MLSRNRKRELVTGGHGTHYLSPVKPRTSKAKNKKINLGDASRRAKLCSRLNAMLAPRILPETPAADISEWADVADHDMLFTEVPEERKSPNPGEPMQVDLIRDDDKGDHEEGDDNPDDDHTDDYDDDHDAGKRKRRILPNAASYRLYSKWREMVPCLVDEYLRYTNATIGKPVGLGCSSVILRSACACAKLKETSLTCLFYDYFRLVVVHHCHCQPIAQQLIKHGLFPAAPDQPRVAVALELLGFYRALFERSCDAVNAFAEALHSHYTRRGFHVINKKGDYIEDPWRKSLGAAIQWHDTLQVDVQKRLDLVMEEASAVIQRSKADSQSTTDGTNCTEASRLLQSRCPACFGGRTWGKSFNNGADVHMSLDGNFHHRHQTSSGDGPHFYDPVYFLSKEEVDGVGDDIDTARKRPPRKFKFKVPEEAIEECEKSHEAANGNKQKTDMGHFDDTGVAALVCRHGIPVFFANIDTPGERQKYAVALIKHAMRELPLNATAVYLYDVGCVLDVSCNKFKYFDDEMLSRIMFATTAMHAYAHQWSCQLIYNPRLKPDLGLSDGEGVERLWSRLRRLIGVTRTAGRRRRKWLLDRQLGFIGFDMRSSLGDWIRRKLKSGVVAQTSESQRVLDGCGATDAELREQWKMQVKAQTSIRAYAPKRLRKEVDAVMVLQEDVSAVEKVIEDARSTLAEVGAGSVRATKDSISDLREHHRQLLVGVEKLYASLNIQERFPELADVDVEFVRTLLMARDLKINIRKRAIASFIEWERLDQAVGGKHQALGTTAHQRTRQAITARKPALMRAIRTFNKYCAKLEDLHKPSCAIPLPEPLPVNLGALRDRSDLMEDVWISREKETMPRWLEDLDIRNGMRAMLKKDACLIERRRLGSEADNLIRWLGRELAAVELAVCTPSYSLLHPLLLQHQRQLLFLEKRWATPLASNVRFRTAVEEAKRTVQILSGEDPAFVLEWMTPAFSPTVIAHDEGDSDEMAEAELSTSAAMVESDIAIAVDDLDDADDDEEIVEKASATIVWNLPEDLILDPSNNFAVAEEDLEPLPSLRDNPRRQFTALPNRRFPVIFEKDTFQQLISPTALLNDNSVNGAALFMQTELVRLGATHPDALGGFDPASIAILSTHDLVLTKFGVPDDQIWRNTRKTEYWRKKVWVLPVHRPDAHHWVMCVIYPNLKQINLFDSFAQHKPWNGDLKHIMTLVARMCCIARRQGHPCIYDNFSDWIAHPLLIKPVQTNGYDCGLWVLAVVWSILRGYTTTTCREADIKHLRRWILNLIVQIDE